MKGKVMKNKIAITALGALIITNPIILAFTQGVIESVLNKLTTMAMVGLDKAIEYSGYFQLVLIGILISIAIQKYSEMDKPKTPKKSAKTTKAGKFMLAGKR